MTPEQRKARIEELLAIITPAQKELAELKQGCGEGESFHQIVKDGSSAYCDVCLTYHGWWCPDSGVGVCDYEHPWVPEPGDTVTLKEPKTPLGYSNPVTEFVISEVLPDGRFAAEGYLFSATLEELVEEESTYDEDNCRYCHHPEERK